MDPALERITTVDERAKEEVKKAREYAAAVTASRAGECEDAADAEREVVREKVEGAARAAEAKADEEIAAARAEADARIESIRRAEAENGDLIAAAIVREITEGAL